MNKYTELIDKYLNGALNAAEKLAFEKQLESNSELRSEFQTQQQLLQGIQTAGIRSEIKKGFKKGSFKTKAGKWMLGLAIATLAVTTVIVIKEKSLSKKENIRYELNEENNKNWSEADRQLSPQIFSINGGADTVIETKGGIILQIPAGAFLNSTGDAVSEPYELEVKEALTPLDIMKAGLSTTSNGKLLETGGMFYVNARKDGKNLTIPANKVLNAAIPDQHPGKKMLLFDGKRTEDGQINWVDPKPMESVLIPVDIMSLDFYPPHFLDSLNAMGFDTKNKKLTDSIYYSFVCTGFEGEARVFYGSDSVSRPLVSDTTKAPDSRPDGALLFKQNCVVCHSMSDQKLTGPGLLGVIDRVPKGAWLKNFIRNSAKMIHDGDPYANKIYVENGKASMTVFEGISEADLDALVAYLGGSNVRSIPNSGSSPCEIAPSRIRAIWNKKFNNTLLATKEFEARLREIFKTCNHSLLDLYVQNMDKKMFEIDSLAMVMNENSEVFRDFYAKRQGGIPMQAEKRKKLHAYMEQKRALYEKTAVETLKELYKKENIQDEKAMYERNDHELSEVKRINTAFFEELEVNMKEAYIQLGKPYEKAPARAYLETEIISTGWKNVDAYVMESTFKRETLDYTDPETGKKAIIRYEPLTLNVEDAEQYDRVIAYLIPDKLSTFQKMPETGKAIFKENLNELFNYTSLVLGFKGDEVYCNSVANVKPGTLKLGLSKMSRRELRHYSELNGADSRDLMKELQYQVFEQKDTARKKLIKKREELRLRLLPVVFPCGNYPAPVQPQSSELPN